jgi:predicted transcriptional regulator
MNFKTYINNDFSPLGLSAHIKQVKEHFKNLPFTHFPIVENNKLIGMLAQSDVLYIEDDFEEIYNLTHLLQHYDIQGHTNCLDLLSLFAENDTDIIPVVDNNKVYLGYFELDEIIRLFYKTPFLESDATTLIIEKETEQFTMSEIAQIVESNNIDILGLYISEQKGNKTQITLRMETEHINEAIQSLRRYGYHVLNQNESDLLMEQLKERSEYLQKFLDI